MMERPVLFSAPMVNAILEGRKTQTRRIINQKDNPHDFLGGIQEDKDDPLNWGFENPDVMAHFVTLPEQRCAHGRVGDTLWVRENFRFGAGYDNVKPSAVPKESFVKVWYEADGETPPHGFGKQRPSIFLPRYFSRLTLKITDIRVERLQSISDSDAVAEGVRDLGDGVGEMNMSYGIQKALFCNLWKKINGAASWDSNPFVWVIGFERVRT
jgi:hypothetical protein